MTTSISECQTPRVRFTSRALMLPDRCLQRRNIGLSYNLQTMSALCMYIMPYIQVDIESVHPYGFVA
jgi:hypothetical protein